ncbi:MAG: M23 family metallopeptidase [Myxococcales bacterium]|nr:M23 family metallopeptidase [Myxococcales bacterium]
MRQRVGLIEALGLRPLGPTLRAALLTFAGDEHTPPSRFDLSSLRQLRPRYALPLWLGGSPCGRRVPITNLFNHRQPPPEHGWSVRVTQVLDFRGGGNTYDSHNGTDLAVPPGTQVVAAAPGVVLRVSSEFNRGGRKIFLDHGRGLATSYNHLSRPLVQPGQQVARGEVIALSGYSGIDALTTFPWTPPHVHMNVWLNGCYVDPFARPGEASLWRSGNDPAPYRGQPGRDPDDLAFSPTRFEQAAIEFIASCCRHADSRAEILGATTQTERAGAALMHLSYYPSRFVAGTTAAILYGETFVRQSRLDLPFSAEDYDGVFFPERGPAIPPVAGE